MTHPPGRSGGATARTFASDNWAGIHPTVLAAIVEANAGGGHVPAYGADPVTAAAEDLFRAHFGEEAEVYLAFNGTGANVVGLQSLLRPFEGVICAASAHIAVDECGAPERFLGSKLITVATPDGKLTPSLVEGVAGGVGDEHRVQPKVVSITQSTEVGTCYTVEEIVALTTWAHDRDLLVHLDGARLANAAAGLGEGLGAFGGPAGVDVLSFGGTKNGAMGAEAVVSFLPVADSPLRYIRKQSMQLASKMRFVSAQFVALLTDDLWLANAGHANAMARRLAEGVAMIPGVSLAHPCEANGVFAVLPPAVTATVQERYPFYVWEESTGVVRWMTSFDTTEEDVDGLVAAVASTMEAHRRAAQDQPPGITRR